jgi:hypothetical protein
VTWDLEKQAELEIQQLLEGVPLAKNNPFGRSYALDKVIDSLESTIKRLKGFVRFLSLLNPTQYLKWMSDAFAHYVPGKATSKNNRALPAAEVATSTERLSSVRQGIQIDPNKRPTP